MKCKLSEKCEFGNLCKDATRHDSLTVLGCSSFKTKKPMTEQEYIQTCNTGQLAEWLVEVTQYCYECGTDVRNCEYCPFGKCIDKGFAMEWLKQPHEDTK